SDEGRKGGGLDVGYGDRDAAVHKRLDDFHADEPPADDDGGLDASGVDSRLHRHRAGHRPEGEDAAEVVSGNGRTDGGGAGGEYELVVGEETLLAGGGVGSGDDLLFPVDARRHVSRVDGDILHVAEEVRVADDAERRADKIL